MSKPSLPVIPPIPGIPDRHRLHELLEAHRAELLALAEDELVPTLVSRDRAYELTGVLLPNIRALDARIGQELHPERAAERRRQIDLLEERALVYYAADLTAAQTFANTTRQRQLQLAAAVKRHDRLLFNWAVAHFGEDPVIVRELDDIRSGKGRRDDAEDTLRLVAIFRERWSEVSGQTALTLERLERAAEDAAELLDLLRPSHRDPSRDLARRAYLAWQRDYWELHMLGRYLERADATEAMRRFPGIRPASSSAPADADDDAGDIPVTDPADQPDTTTPESDTAAS